MTVHHLNCASMHPRFGPPAVAHVLLVERPEGLLLVDTGLGTGDLGSRSRTGRGFVTVQRPRLAPTETAVSQVAALGHEPGDVTDIVLTHLDLDHAGGLGDFPAARVHLHRDELEAATRPSLRERARYLAAQWEHGPHWVRHDEFGEDWFGFRATTLSDDVLLVPLPGHTRGHCGVAVRRPDGHWLLHAGDTTFDSGDLHVPPSCHRGLALFQAAMALDNGARRATVERLRALSTDQAGAVTVFCAHDKQSFDDLAAGAPGGAVG
ncbi:glyoxylase-like metal-dependent hydrolase (beta-lactamase superfamily II) [Nocardioides thalensis]|uniref:Glyoxylase-like metal-dependent hydrolase (Beta-lactamase superfamily II) n=1 Tax=Nocardioides thalensis TaxID=1914755 RepID=A0A853C9B9_9ACTN|nr:MBL fold metallo-hydrolase [Nocardioides thalensis]NYJ03606.1 glyoxylase-like metal-dependent hydrolase (beta-lactamase superfamily II) [Nocardioides thalensis]